MTCTLPNPPSLQEFAWLHDRPPCRNSLTAAPGGVKGNNMRVCSGALIKEKNFIHVLIPRAYVLCCMLPLATLEDAY